MENQFTLGIEEEFQLVNRQTGELCSCAESILEKGVPYFAEKIKPEMLQSTVEFVSEVLPDMAAARTELYSARSLLSRLANEEDLAIVSAGTHPTAQWRDQKRTQSKRYEELEEEYQDVGRSILIFGLHVHVGVQNKELAVKIMSQARTWLPHMLALSSNSPFWHRRMTGLKSYRSVVWKRFPRSGLPEQIPSRSDFEHYVQDLVDLGCIDNGKRIWWDIRPHAFFDTVEFRIFDMPATIQDTLALAALSQALVARLARLNEQGKGVPTFPRDYIEENKWRAMRYGLDAEALDFEHHRRLSMRDAIRELLAFVEEVVDDLGSRQEFDYLQALLDDPRGTGADRQIAVYQQSGNIEQVLRHLMEQTMSGVPLEEPDPSKMSFNFKMSEHVS